jgi:hypothetical protein
MSSASGWGSRPIFLPDDYRNEICKVVPPKNDPALAQQTNGSIPQSTKLPAETAEGREGSSFVKVPINWPEAEREIRGLRADGYLLAGLIPGMHITANGDPYDTLVLYKPPSDVNIDFDHIWVVDALRSLHAFAKEEYQKTRGRRF